MSELLTVFDALADYPIYLDGDVVPVWRLGKAKNAVETANLPIRIQLPAGTDGGNAPITGLDTFGRSSAASRQATTTWTLTELFLNKPKGQGLGVGDEWLTVTKFLSAYANMIVNKRNTISRNISIVSWNPQASEVVWPLQANRAYYGAIIRVVIQEVLCPCLPPNC